jgi:hypothetical protein
LIYPVLRAPNAIDFLDNKSLKDAFWEFVLHDPEILFLGNKAIKADPDLTQVYREGRRQRGAGWEWSFEFFQGELAGGRSKESPIGFIADPLRQEVQLAADTVSNSIAVPLDFKPAGRNYAANCFRVRVHPSEPKPDLFVFEKQFAVVGRREGIQ